LKTELERHFLQIACPIHGLKPRSVEVYGRSIYDLHIRVDACCDTLADELLVSLRDTPSRSSMNHRD
jgi:hypothetical protein